MLNLYYRISDKGYPKVKLPGATKKACLANCLQAFPDSHLYVVADRCEERTLTMLGGFFRIRTLEQSHRGNAGSLIYTIEKVIKDRLDDDLVYFVEDDYLHQPDAKKVLLEGFEQGDYVTLYDHPDKYTKCYDGGETSKVTKTQSSHWRFTVSTCMTFATRVKTLKEDYNVWKRYTVGDHPCDHQIFSELTSQGRKLAVCIPGKACHTDLAFSGAVNHLLIDSWAIEQMVQTLSLEVEGGQPTWVEELKSVLLTSDVQGWERLKRLDAITQAIKKAR